MPRQPITLDYYMDLSVKPGYREQETKLKRLYDRRKCSTLK